MALNIANVDKIPVPNFKILSHHGRTIVSDAVKISLHNSTRQKHGCINTTSRFGELPLPRRILTPLKHSDTEIYLIL
jgi:hypothetical protein